MDALPTTSGRGLLVRTPYHRGPGRSDGTPDRSCARRRRGAATMSEDRTVDVGAITEAFVPTARPDVVHVEIDGEMVLYDDRAKVMHRLSPSAAQVWRCLDGSGSLAEIASDLAEVYQADQNQILTDVVATARQFGSAGLLVGIG